MPDQWMPDQWMHEEEPTNEPAVAGTGARQDPPGHGTPEPEPWSGWSSGSGWSGGSDGGSDGAGRSGGGGWYYDPSGFGPHGGPPFPPGGPGTPYRRSPWRRSVVALTVAAVVVASGGLGAAIGVGVHDHAASEGSSGSFPNLPFPGGGGQETTPGGVAPTSGIDAAAVARKVDPVVVDINTTLAGGGRAAGTGIVIGSSGLVLTNNHVIADATSISAQIAGTGRTYSGSVVGYDVVDDVAVVRLQGASGLQTASLGDSSSVSVGTPVVAIGNALGQGGTPQATEGTVTAVNQTITVQGEISPGETLSGLIQFNAPIQSGDSGGPLVNAQGQVVGMDTAAAFGGGGFRARLAPSDAGFAIPVNTAVSIAHRITAGRDSGNIHTGPRPLLGIEVGDVGSQSGGGFGGFGGFGGSGQAPVGSGALVLGVNSGSPAASVGLSAGDVIVSLGGQPVSDAGSLTNAILGHRVGDRVSVGWVDQSGSHHTASVTLASGPPA